MSIVNTLPARIMQSANRPNAPIQWLSFQPRWFTVADSFSSSSTFHLATMSFTGQEGDINARKRTYGLIPTFERRAQDMGQVLLSADHELEDSTLQSN
jgi:hypothetical protein